MATALDVARFLVHLAAAEEEPDFLTQMRVHKLLYYAQGWSLALRNTRLFEERIEAWAHGPVVRDVYPSFADWKDAPIDPTKTPEAENLSPDEQQLIGSVWESYKDFTAAGLRAKTHSESPWLNARGGLGPAEKCETEITTDSMQAYFRDLTAA